MIKQMLLVGLGGGIGSMFRFSVSFLAGKFHLVAAFPAATFIVNITGCILIGLLVGFSERYGLLDRDLKLLLITGFCGGYTTFSAFSLENIRLLEAQQYALFALYAAGSLILGISSVALGILLSK
ncbi:MAG: fluoride efflux transporter CrcB [Tannerellaceae bacterium]|jgi:CrcB protein|nr:fluoride efflux transporter CrcB [Tannerellaceae bacterium]